MSPYNKSLRIRWEMAGAKAPCRPLKGISLSRRKRNHPLNPKEKDAGGVSIRPQTPTNEAKGAHAAPFPIP